jgi:hypothetical protein
MSSSPSPGSVLFAGWLVPGGGHLLVGRRTQGIVFFLTITITFLAGMYLCSFRNVSPTRHEYYFLAHILNGGETIVASVATSGLVEDQVPRHFGIASGEIGTLYSAVAGLLNVIVAMDAFGIAAGVHPKESRDRKSREEVPAEAAEAAPAPHEEPTA